MREGVRCEGLREWPVFEFGFKFESHPTIKRGRQREWVYIFLNNYI